MDLIVTTPKSEIANSAREAADVLAAGGGTYFRFLGERQPSIPHKEGTRMFYVMDGFVRGYCMLRSIEWSAKLCETTKRNWPRGFYAVMDATTWCWIKPIPFRGFQRWRYRYHDTFPAAIEVVGNWRDTMPPTPNAIKNTI